MKKALVFGFEQRVHVIAINHNPQEHPMIYPTKAHAGDFLFIDGTTQRVIFVHDRDTRPEYELAEGRYLGNCDFSYDDVLLESECW